MSDKYRVTQSRYIGNELKASAGELVYLVGEAREDTERTGQIHAYVIKKPGAERFSIPSAHLHRIEKPIWP